MTDSATPALLGSGLSAVDDTAFQTLTTVPFDQQVPDLSARFGRMIHICEPVDILVARNRRNLSSRSRRSDGQGDA
jgi:hypothetical protein